MSASNWTCRDMANRYIGTRELPGGRHNPLVVGMLQMFATWVRDDETAWCGAFAGFVAFSQGFEVPGPEKWSPLRARYWLTTGDAVPLSNASGNCVVVFKRGRGYQPGNNVLDAPGHVAIYESHDDRHVTVIGGNQRNRVSRARYPRSDVLGVRRLKRAS